eukprot:Sspe_Gene.42006::Locus_20361_Transcript_5_5_Confidence_0.500_Length_1449::g.42006::m.42006
MECDRGSSIGDLSNSSSSCSPRNEALTWIEDSPEKHGACERRASRSSSPCDKMVECHIDEGNGTTSVRFAFRSLLIAQSSYFRGLLDGGDWMDKWLPIQVPNEDRIGFLLFLDFLEEGRVTVDAASKSGRLELLHLCQYADKIGAEHLKQCLAQYVTSDTVLMLLHVGFLYPVCLSHLITHFGTIFGCLISLKNRVRDIPYDTLRDLLSSDALQVNEEMVLGVAIAWLKAHGLIENPEVCKEVLGLVRLKDVCIYDLDHLREEPPTVVNTILPDLCSAYAHIGHIAQRTRFKPFLSRSRVMFERSMRLPSSWNPGEIQCPRLQGVEFSVRITTHKDGQAVGVTLHPRHSYPDPVPMKFTLTVEGGTEPYQLSFRRAFTDCNAYWGWDNIGVPREALEGKMGTWVLSGAVQFIQDGVDDLPLDLMPEPV